MKDESLQFKGQKILLYFYWYEAKRKMSNSLKLSESYQNLVSQNND